MTLSPDPRRVKAWHFVRVVDGKPVLRDGRPVVVGEWLEHTGPLVACQSGLHASIRPLDALEYSPGTGICRVEIEGERVEHGGDKLCARRRRVIWYADAERELRLFAADCAERALKMCKRKGYKTDPRSWAAVKAARQYARGEIGAAARDAAWAAARDAAWDAAWAAARDAAWDAAWDAARDAAWAAAWDAARDAARAAAWDAAWAAARAAAGDAAWDAAWAAEKDWQSRRLARWLEVAHKRAAGGKS